MIRRMKVVETVYRKYKLYSAVGIVCISKQQQMQSKKERKYCQEDEGEAEEGVESDE